MRRQIADHMVRSVTTAPRAWFVAEVDVGRVARYRAEQQSAFRERFGFPLSYVALFVQIVSRSLSDNPFLNATWTERGIVIKHHINVGMAVALPNGLVVPVIKDADRKGLVELAEAVHDLAERGRSHKLRVEDVEGGTFTLNNTGPFGSVLGQAILNHPQAAILTTGAIRERVVAIGESIAIKPMMYLSMSVDNRVVDGGHATRFLSTVRERFHEWDVE